nr:VOC family protein [uncultured Agathobaculum sp.]
MKELYKGLGHIAIYTTDMDKSIAFYKKIGGSVYKRDGVATSEGEKKLTLIVFGGFLLELIQPPVGVSVPAGEGSLPHFAVYVDDLDQAAAATRQAGVTSFTTPENKVLPDTFGGLQNWFFTGLSGEQIELLQML